MNDAITIALIGLAGSGVGSILGVLASAKLTNYRLEQLEQRVQAHNNLPPYYALCYIMKL